MSDVDDFDLWGFWIGVSLIGLLGSLCISVLFMFASSLVTPKKRKVRTR
jgi:hypothetical protein